MYERLEIWKRVGNSLAIRFQCLRRLSDNMFAVQNADYLRPESLGMDVQASQSRFVELLLDDDPTDRCDWFPSLREASPLIRRTSRTRPSNGNSRPALVQ